MVNIVESMVSQRTEFVNYCSTILSEESILWVKRFFSEINKVILIKGDDDFTVKVWPLYKNVKRFITDFAEEESSSSILLTLYICGLELGILHPGDVVEKMIESKEDIPLVNWNNIQFEDMFQLDLYFENVLIRRAYYGEDAECIYAGGLRVLSLLDYLEVS